MNTTYWLNTIMGNMYTDAATEFWVGLSSTIPSQDGTGVSEPTGGNYARVKITAFTDPVNGTIKNVSALEFNRSSAVWFDSDHKARYWVLFDGNTKTFGLECDGDEGNDTLRQKWEFKNNTETLCSFQTDRFFELIDGKKRVLAGLESTYPDQGDLEEKGLEPKYDHLQVLYTWVYQRANFWDASTETLTTPKTYNGVRYTTERDYRTLFFLLWCVYVSLNKLSAINCVYCRKDKKIRATRPKPHSP